MILCPHHRHPADEVRAPCEHGLRVTEKERSGGGGWCLCRLKVNMDAGVPTFRNAFSFVRKMI
jgi:hypothetical protein